MDSSQPADVALQVEHLQHSFKNHRALVEVNFSVRRGSIHGFVGPNGAGKTTTLKIIATLLRPQGGSVSVFGLHTVRQVKQVRKRIGFMPDHFSMYRQMTLYEYLDFFGAAYGLNMNQRNRTIADVLALTDMQERRNDLIKSLSRGMQQRVNLARVLINDPDLLLLDEPASGLDPRARIELMAILQELRRMDKTIFISSHILSELATLCDAVTIIDRGLIVYSGAMEELLSHGTDTQYVLTLAEPHAGVVAALPNLDGITEFVADEEKPSYRLGFDPERIDTATILRSVIDTGAQIIDFKRDERHLNKAFMDLTEPGVRP